MIERQITESEMISVLNPGHMLDLKKKEMTLLEALRAELRNTPYDSFQEAASRGAEFATSNKVKQLKKKKEFLEAAIAQLESQGKE